MPQAIPVCWICRARPANSVEHRFKASDVRARLRLISQQNPAYVHRGKATNHPIGSARNKALAFKTPICTECNNVGTQPYDEAWEKLSEYLHANWPAIVRRGQFDLSKPFPGGTRQTALDVHLYFVKLFGCKAAEENLPIDLKSFSSALMNRTAHPEIVLQVANAPAKRGEFVAYETEINIMREKSTQEIHGATWGYLIHSVAVKVSYIKTGALLHTPGWAWRPNASGKIVKLGPYMGATEPNAGPKAIVE